MIPPKVFQVMIQGFSSISVLVGSRNAVLGAEKPWLAKGCFGHNFCLRATQILIPVQEVVSVVAVVRWFSRTDSMAATKGRNSN
jgi:hypothetical protein